jgi:hypothetical protein
MHRTARAWRRIGQGALVALAWLAPAPPASGAAAADTTVVAGLRREAESALPLMKTALARGFLAAAGSLPEIAPRALVQDSVSRAWHAAADIGSLPDSVRQRLVPRTFDGRFYYYTRYGSPLAYARALELLGEAGVADAEGLKIADFGCGGIGPLRLLAGLGARVTGIDVDPLLERLYAFPGDQGDVGDRGGHVELVTGRFPVDPVVAEAVGGGYDLFLSKNTLKRGYVHPEAAVDPRQLVNLGVDDSTFVATLARILEPGGHALIYNLSPAPNQPGRSYRPWADGRSPFARELWERAGFEVLAFDRSDDEAARALGRALGWDRGGSAMKLDTDLFALYTLVRKRP